MGRSAFLSFHSLCGSAQQQVSPLDWHVNLRMVGRPIRGDGKVRTPPPIRGVKAGSNGPEACGAGWEVGRPTGRELMLRAGKVEAPHNHCTL